MRLYNEIVELMLVVWYRNRSISPFNSVPIMHISKCDFATFWHIHSANLLVQSAVSRFWGIPLANSAKICVKPCTGLPAKGRRDSNPPLSQSVALISFYPLLSLGSNTPLI